MTTARNHAHLSCREEQTSSFEYILDGRKQTGHVRGETLTGADKVLLSHDDDLTQGCSWSSRGFVVAPFLEPTLQSRLIKGLRTRIVEALDAFFPGRRESYL